MPDYTWIADLLREIDTFAVENGLNGLSRSLLSACVALKEETGLETGPIKTSHVYVASNAVKDLNSPEKEPCLVLRFLPRQ